MEYCCEDEERKEQKKHDSTNKEDNISMKNIFNVGQANQYLATSKSCNQSGFFHLALNTGMRFQELLNLRWIDLDLVSGNIYINSTLSAMSLTDRRKRCIELDSETNDMLRTQKAVQISNKNKRNTAHSDLHRVFLSTKVINYHNIILSIFII
jgi:integrase